MLTASLPGQDGTAFSHLLAKAEAARIRIWAEGAPFELKDQLRQRGYRWSDGSDGRPRSWWVEVDEPLAEAEIAFLENEIYMRRVRPGRSASRPASDTRHNQLVSFLLASC